MSNNTGFDVQSAQPEKSEERMASIQAFVGSSAAYYIRQFDFIGSKPGITWTFNLAAAILGPIWYGMRGIWHWALTFIFLEAFASVPVGRED